MARSTDKARMRYETALWLIALQRHKLWPLALALAELDEPAGYLPRAKA